MWIGVAATRKGFEELRYHEIWICDGCGTNVRRARGRWRLVGREVRNRGLLVACSSRCVTEARLKLNKAIGQKQA